MPRIEADDDSHDNHDEGRWLSSPDWRRRLLTWGLIAAGLGLGFLIPYTLYLDHQVTERFGQLRWQLPTRVYARPLQLAPGMAMDATTLRQAARQGHIDRLVLRNGALVPDGRALVVNEARPQERRHPRQTRYTARWHVPCGELLALSATEKLPWCSRSPLDLPTLAAVFPNTHIQVCDDLSHVCSGQIVPFCLYVHKPEVPSSLTF